MTRYSATSEPVFPGEERRNCEGKQSWPNFTQARKAVKHRRNKGSAYRCDECGRIHVSKRQGK